MIRPFTLLLVAGLLAVAQKPTFEVVETTIAGVHAAIKAGDLSCAKLVDSYVKRIRAFDKNGPAINAIVLVNPDVAKDAEELDRRFAQSGLTGPLHCVPVIVKDNFETKGLQTTNGALALAGYVPDKDAFQVRRMREAGAIVLAKSNMAEWAFSPYETVSSIVPGYTKNPYALDRVSAGSSGGTAAAVAASMGLVGLGTDTGNSIRGPSSHQALVGIRSTMGLTSRAGIFPNNLLADIAGPMTRTVEDLARVFQVIAGEDPDDAVTAVARDQPRPDYIASLDRTGLRGGRLGVLREAYERDTADPEIIRLFDAAVQDLRAAGSTIVDVRRIQELERVTRISGAGVCMGFKYTINQYLRTRGERTPVKTLSEILKSERFHPSVQRRLELSEQDAENGPDSPACQAERIYREKVRTILSSAMHKLKVDALIYPTWSNPPRLIGDLNTPHGNNSPFYSPTSGLPAITVPMGFTRGGTLPAGMTLIGPPWSEATLLRFAYAYEQLTHHRRPPSTTPPLP